MKTLKFGFAIILMAVVVPVNNSNAQTIQKELRSSFTNIDCWCMGGHISGEFVIHVTYHLDRETGKVDRLKWNTGQSNIWNTETGEKYVYIDNGNDNSGFNWEVWNNINDYVDNKYNVENGWLPLPDELPLEGSFVGMSFKIIGKGGNKVSMKFMWQYHINANGEITVDKIVEYADCNEP